jgi:hypothetical protein
VDINTPTSEFKTHTINHGGGRERSPYRVQQTLLKKVFVFNLS